MSSGDDRERAAARDLLQRAVVAYRELFEDVGVRFLRMDLDDLLLREKAPEQAPEQAARTRSSVPKVCEQFPSIVGTAAPLLEVFELILKVAPTQTTVLIQGESGTGKELVARAIHDHSTRAGQVYVAENCAAFPESLLESELFGHTRGAFTGADRNRQGRFVAADKGTLFLDEVGDMSPNLQRKLLRALQDGEIRPVGGNKTVHVDVRFLSASNKNLTELVQKGLFRDDLYYRLSPICILLPPLRERSSDVPLLIERLGARVAEQSGRREPPEFTAAAMQALQEYRWPGNVRELQNELQRAVALAEPGQAIDLSDLSPSIRPQ